MTEKACGIVCEYNPFHNGHRYQYEQIRETLGLTAVCAMSGSFVQRAEPACMDKSLRARQAVAGGASVVLEVPFPYSCLTAERFAAAGVSVLARSGMCSHIAFGSECADVGALTEIAAALTDSSVAKEIRDFQKERPDTSYARARQGVLNRVLGERMGQICSNPNDILGIEYIKAIRTSGAELIPVALARTTARTGGPNGAFASSSHVRALLWEHDAESAAAYVPDAGILENFTRYERFREALHLLLTFKEPRELAGICEYGGGIEHAVSRAARTARSYEEMFRLLRCKTLTDAKLRRMLLFGALGVSEKTAGEPLLYTAVLAAADDERTAELLRCARREKQMIIARRVSAVRKDAAAMRQYRRNELAEKLLAWG